jgi:glycosyltransferase involved in cell wall biosynthesis
MAPASQPRVSIVVASNGCRETVDVLVDVVRRHPQRASLEVLIVSPGSHRAANDRSSDQPFVRHVVAPVGAAPGELRANGIRHASGDVVILLDGDRAIDAALLDSLLAPAARADE